MILRSDRSAASREISISLGVGEVCAAFVSEAMAAQVEKVAKADPELDEDSDDDDDDMPARTQRQ